MKNHYSSAQAGFTLLELLATLAIITTLSLFSLPVIQEWNAKRYFQRTVNDIYSSLANTRIEAFAKSTTTKITTSLTGGIYTIQMFYNDTNNSASCASSNGWVQFDTTTISISNNFEITGSGIGSICFFKDGTSSGGSFNITQKDGGTELGNSSIDIFMATGFIDVTNN